MGYIFKDENLDVVYYCLAVMTTLEVKQKEIVLHSTKPSEVDGIATYSFKYSTSFSIPSRKILSTCYDVTTHLKC